MHWVWATSHTGQPIPVNLAGIKTMHRSRLQDANGQPTGKEVTILYLGGCCTLPSGTIDYAKTLVIETPDELFELPKVNPGNGGGGGRKRAPSPASRAVKPSAPAARVLS